MTDARSPASGGVKRWYVAVFTGDYANESRYLRSGIGGGFLDNLDRASWFATRGEALDAIRAENMDATKFECAQLSVECGAIIEHKVPWL